MVSRNSNFASLQRGYLFVEIAQRKKKFSQEHPTEKLISLGIGDTTEPLPPPIVDGIAERLKRLSNVETYTGYPDYNGDENLRSLISCKMYGGKVDKEEIFISDGSKPDLGRLQFLFDSQNTTIAVQDPVYPVYVDSAVISGKGGAFQAGTQSPYENIVYMHCTPDNNFFPDLTKLRRTDLIYFCSPNNPTGACATRAQLTSLVNFAVKNRSIIIFDSAYREFISDPSIPKSIYEIEGAKEVAFETCSFSKLVGFTGVRLGWTVCPKSLKFKCGAAVWDDWSRIMGTLFNGPSNLAESGGLATLTDDGMAAMRGLIDYYMSNVKLIKPVLEGAGLSVHGGVHSPYIWVKVPSTMVVGDCDGSAASDATKQSRSWAMFQELLDNCSLVCTPGIGFGKGGEGFVRLSMFAHKENVAEAATRLQSYLKKKQFV